MPHITYLAYETLHMVFVNISQHDRAICMRVYRRQFEFVKADRSQWTYLDLRSAFENTRGLRTPGHPVA